MIYQLPVDAEQFSPSRKEKLHHPHPDNEKIEQMEILEQVGIVLETIDQRSEMYCTNFFKLLYVMNGSCLVHIRGAQFQIKEQQVVLFSPMIQHEQVISDPSSVILMMGISEKTMEQFALPGLTRRDKLFQFLVRTLKNSQKGIAILDIQKDFGLYEFIRLLWHYYDQPNDGFFQRQMQLVFSLFLNQADFLSSDTAVFYEDSLVYSEDTIILDILHFIKERSADVTLELLSREFSYDRTYLSHRIKQATGKNFSQLVMESRLEKAKTLLSYSSFSIEEIGSLVGYPSRNNFARVFRQYTGFSPKEYKTAKDVS